MSPSNEYPSRLAKLDPLTTLHIKVPSSVIPIYAREADAQIRHSSFLMREVIVANAQKLATRHEAEDKLAKQRQAAVARKKVS